MGFEFPILNTKRLQLRQINQDDLSNIFEGLSHPDVIKYYGVSFSTLDATEEQMIWFGDLEKANTGIWWAVCDKANGIFLGACGFNNLEEKHQKAEIGFWLLPDYWAKGIMSEAVRLILDYGFNQLNLHRIEGFVESDNANSKHLLEKMEFQNEGTMRDCEIKNGSYISLCIYSRINPNTDKE